MEDKEKVLSLSQLTKNMGNILDNPMIIPIVEAAESPKAADNHMLELGWSNKTAQQVRAAAKIKRDYPQVWRELIITGKPDASLIYTFKGISLQYNWEIRVGNTFICGNETADRTLWPFFLTEFALGNDSVTSCIGSLNNNEAEIHPLFKRMPDVEEITAFSKSRCIGSQVYYGGCLEVRVDERNSFLSCYFEGPGKGPGKYKLHSQSIIIQPYATCFPEFYKVFAVSNKEWDRNKRNMRESILVFMRQDYGPKLLQERTKIGFLIYRRIYDIETVEYGEKHNVENGVLSSQLGDNECSVELRAHYNIYSPDFSVQMETDAKPTTSIIFSPIISGAKPINELSIAGKDFAFNNFKGLMEKIYFERSHVISLESIAGLSIITNPPQMLSDLIVGG